MADGMVLGAGLDPASQMGPLVSAKQRARVDGFVQGALAQGARLVAVLWGSCAGYSGR